MSKEDTDFTTQVLAERLVKWIAAGIDNDRHIEEHRNARVYVRSKVNESSGRASDQKVLVEFSNGLTITLPVKVERADLGTAQQTKATAPGTPVPALDRKAS